ncbi:MAG: LacI family DNA-binding transcriptional regulator [Glaciecola sp.]
MKKKLNLTQVAKHIGVSIATVSNAFNRPDQLSAKLRQRILDESAKLGYHGPNLAARSLRMGESGIIGVMLTDTLSYTFSDQVASQFLRGISEVLVDHRKQLLLLSCNGNSIEQSSAESLPDGFIIYGSIPQQNLLTLARLNKPLVKADTPAGDTQSVNINNESAAKAIAHHAFNNSISKEKIANHTANEQSNEHAINVSVMGLRLVDAQRVTRLTNDDLGAVFQQLSYDRLMGYMQAAEENDIEIPLNRIWHIPVNDMVLGEIAAREALTTSPRPNVLLCMSDILALSALKVARELGIRVPQDVQITGFDDIPEAARSEPTLTTICQQSIEKGRIAANLLLESLKQGDTNKHIELDTRLVVRGSCPD